MHNNCARKFHAQYLHRLGLSFVNVQYMCKIVLLSPMHNIYAQDCTYFPNAQYMCTICTRLYFFPQCAIYVQDLLKIILLSPMRNKCTRFVQDCTSFPNAQLCTIFVQDCTLYFSPQFTCAIYAQDCRHYWKNMSHISQLSALNLEWYSLHSYFWIATSFDFFLHKHL